MNFSRSVVASLRVNTLRLSLLGLFGLCVFLLGTGAFAQEREKGRETPGKPAQSNKLAATTQESGADQPQGKSKFSTRIPEHEDPEQVKNRELWFYKQRAFPNPTIPPGARYKAYQHRMRMLEREGKIVRRPDGTFEAASANITLGGNWTSLGPAPTTGGFFSPVSGRVKTIAVDPSDTSGNTALVGGAQGGIWRSTDAGATWTPTGDTNPSLAMGSIAFAPSACSLAPAACTVYAGTGEQASIGFDIYYGAGVLKSTDHGQTWTQTCSTPSSTCPFIGPFTNTLNFGFFNDGGARISYIAVNPSNPNLLLVGAQIPRVGTSLSETAGGIYCSDDAGATWHSLLLGGMGSFVGFADATTAYAAIGRPAGSTSGSANGIYKSTNANSSCTGSTPIAFTALAAQPTTSAMGRIDLGVFDANTVYASISNAADGSSTNLGVFKTTNGGTSWTTTGAPDICRFQCWYDNVVKVVPNNSNIVFFGGSAAIVNGGTAFGWVEHSTNGGTSFSPAVPTAQGPGTPHVDQHAMAFFRATSGAFNGKVRMYLGNDGGVWRTDDAEAATVTWTNVNTNLTLSQFYPNLSFSSANPNLLYAGTQDNGSQFFNGGVSWLDNQQCGDGGQTAVDFLVPTVVYATCQFININVSPTGGQDPNSFIFSVNGINFNDNVDFIPPISADPSTAGRAYFGTDHVYQTNDFGNNWTAISGVLSGGFGVLTTIAAAPKNPAVVYAGTDDGLVFVATNVGAGTPATFTQVGAGALPTRNVNAVVPDPNDASGQNAYAVFSGFAIGGDTKGHIFKTINGGTSWLDVSCSVASCITPGPNDLPNIPVNDLVVDPDVLGTLYAATDLGVYATTNGGVTWSTLDTGLPNVAVLSLRLHEPSRLLIATTHGRGAWADLLNNFTFVGPHIRELTPTTANAGAVTATILVDGSGFAPGGVPGVVKWDDSTTGVTTTSQPGSADIQLQASIAASLLTSGGTHQISVTAGAVAQTSNALTFSVLGGAPTLTSVTPPNTPVQTPTPSTNVPIQVVGTNFISGSKVQWNGAANGITTTFTDSQHLSATLPAALLGPFGSTNDITVLNPPPGGGSSNALTFVVQAPAPPNDIFASAISISGTSFTDTNDSSGATNESGDPTPACVQGSATNGRSNSIWYKFAPTTGGNVQLDTGGSNYDTVLSVWTGSALGTLTAVSGGCNDDIVLGVITTSQVSFSATSGTTYSIMVSSFGPPDPNPVALGGKSVLNFSFTPTPDYTITTGGSTTQTVTAGATATYTNVLSITAQNGFSGTVNLSCSSSTAARTTCTVNPTSLAPGGGSATVTVTTTARSLIPPTGGTRRLRPTWRTVPVVFLAMLALFLMTMQIRTRRLRLAASLPLAALVLYLVLQAAGCGGGSSGPPPVTGTPPGTYTITVTGTTAGGPTHTANLTLVVN